MRSLGNRINILEKDAKIEKINYRIQKIKSCGNCKHNRDYTNSCGKHKIQNHKMFGICNDYIVK